MSYYGWIVFIHAISALAFVMTMIIMQLVVANVMKRIPDSPGKKDGINFIQKRWLPIVDAIIVIVGLTGLTIAFLNWDLMISSPIIMIKATIGIIALTCAYSNHFYFRYVKRKLSAAGNNPQRLKRVGIITPVFDKVALIGGVITALLGMYINHV